MTLIRGAGHGRYPPAESYHTDSVSSEQVDSIRRMLLAMVDDFRCVVIKLAERIAHLREVRTRRKMSAFLRQRCTNIYAPTAGRVSRPAELEDYCLHICTRRNTSALPNCSHERRIDREHYIEEFVGHLRSEMAPKMKAEVYGRPKRLSIWRKMQHLLDELF
ncbi:HD domain-containing protein [Klebsiella pneumoniae]|nr:HD domain-containing protein [Klebsiella pneumoniae]